MSEITVKGKIIETSGVFNDRLSWAEVDMKDNLGLDGIYITDPPADWQEGQEVEITIRTVTK